MFENRDSDEKKLKTVQVLKDLNDGKISYDEAIKIIKKYNLEVTI